MESLANEELVNASSVFGVGRLYDMLLLESGCLLLYECTIFLMPFSNNHAVAVQSNVLCYCPISEESGSLLIVNNDLSISYAKLDQAAGEFTFANIKFDNQKIKGFPDLSCKFYSPNIALLYCKEYIHWIGINNAFETAVVLCSVATENLDCCSIWQLRCGLVLMYSASGCKLLCVTTEGRKELKSKHRTWISALSVSDDAVPFGISGDSLGSIVVWDAETELIPVIIAKRFCGQQPICCIRIHGTSATFWIADQAGTLIRAQVHMRNKTIEKLVYLRSPSYLRHPCWIQWRPVDGSSGAGRLRYFSNTCGIACEALIGESVATAYTAFPASSRKCRNPVTHCLLVEHADLLLSASFTNALNFWDLERGTLQYTVKLHEKFCSAVAASCEVSLSLDDEVPWKAVVAAGHSSGKLSVIELCKRPDAASAAETLFTATHSITADTSLGTSMSELLLGENSLPVYDMIQPSPKQQILNNTSSMAIEDDLSVQSELSANEAVPFQVRQAANSRHGCTEGLFGYSHKFLLENKQLASLPITALLFSTHGHFLLACFAHQLLIVYSLLHDKITLNLQLHDKLYSIGPVLTSTPQAARTFHFENVQILSEDSLRVALQFADAVKILDALLGTVLCEYRSEGWRQTIVSSVWLTQLPTGQGTELQGVFVDEHAGMHVYSGAEVQHIRVSTSKASSRLDLLVRGVHGFQEHDAPLVVMWTMRRVVILRVDFTGKAQRKVSDQSVGSAASTLEIIRKVEYSVQNPHVYVIFARSLPFVQTIRSFRVLVALSDGSVFIVHVGYFFSFRLVHFLVHCTDLVRGQSEQNNMKGAAVAEETPRTMREVVQKRFLDEVIGCAVGWKVLVMDDVATRVISSALTMYDIMERRVTIVEQLAKSRQPFFEMDVVYLVSADVKSAEKISKDFESPQKAKYGNVHLFFIDSVPSDVFAVIQSNSTLVNRVKTFKEICLDFLAFESNVYHFDQASALEKLYLPDPAYPAVIGRRMANLCITLNEHPSIRFQGSSPYCREIAASLHQRLLEFKRSNPTFIVNGDPDSRADRERGQLLILDRSFDPLSPLMHDYNYQAMVNDLLEVQDGVITYKATTNKGAVEEKQGVLGENDELWVELRHSHIAKVIATIKERMDDIIQNNAGASLAKANGADLDISTMAAAVKKLPEYTQTMTKLGQHVAIATDCMDQFTKQKLMTLSQVEQTISTGFDEDGKEVKGVKLLELFMNSVVGISRDQKMRLLAIYYISQKSLAGTEEFIRQAFDAAKLNLTDKKVITNFAHILPPPAAPAAAATGKTGGVFSRMFTGKAVKHAPTPEGEYADTRHICQLKVFLDQFLGNELPLDKFPAMGPSAPAAKAEAKSVRKFGAAAKFAKKDNVHFTGGRYMVFVAGGICYPELRVAYELMQEKTKEVVVGSTHLITPTSFLVEVGNLPAPKKREDLI